MVHHNVSPFFGLEANHYVAALLRGTTLPVPPHFSASFVSAGGTLNGR
jgi:hypothetical protein